VKRSLRRSTTLQRRDQMYCDRAQDDRGIASRGLLQLQIALVPVQEAVWPARSPLK
jgi:hypothetical protein